MNWLVKQEFGFLCKKDYHIEQFSCTDFNHRYEITSSITSLAKQRKDIAVCPVCHIERGDFQHGYQETCRNCGTETLSYGNWLGVAVRKDNKYVQALQEPIHWDKVIEEYRPEHVQHVLSESPYREDIFSSAAIMPAETKTIVKYKTKIVEKNSIPVICLFSIISLIIGLLM